MGNENLSVRVFDVCWVDPDPAVEKTRHTSRAHSSNAQNNKNLPGFLVNNLLLFWLLIFLLEDFSPHLLLCVFSPLNSIAFSGKQTHFYYPRQHFWYLPDGGAVTHHLNKTGTIKDPCSANQILKAVISWYSGGVGRVEIRVRPLMGVTSGALGNP